MHVCVNQVYLARCAWCTVETATFAPRQHLWPPWMCLGRFLAISQPQSRNSCRVALRRNVVPSLPVPRAIQQLSAPCRELCRERHRQQIATDDPLSRKSVGLQRDTPGPAIDRDSICNQLRSAAPRPVQDEVSPRGPQHSSSGNLVANASLGKKLQNVSRGRIIRFLTVARMDTSGPPLGHGSTAQTGPTS